MSVAGEGLRRLLGRRPARRTRAPAPRWTRGRDRDRRCTSRSPRRCWPSNPSRFHAETADRDRGRGAAAAAARGPPEPPAAAAAARAPARRGPPVRPRPGRRRRPRAAARPARTPPKPPDAPPVFGVTHELDGRGRRPRDGGPGRQHADDQGRQGRPSRPSAKPTGGEGDRRRSRPSPRSTSPSSRSVLHEVERRRHLPARGPADGDRGRGPR